MCKRVGEIFYSEDVHKTIKRQKTTRRRNPMRKGLNLFFFLKRKKGKMGLSSSYKKKAFLLFGF